ncbi:MAG: histidine kinase [Gemmatimonadetes bacterium]|nr:histidine kinase [Gemmatimonadota bacterium]
MMPAVPDFGPLDVSDFTVGAMLRAGIALRRALRECRTLESAAVTVVRYFHERCVDIESGARSCPLVRFYKTHPYRALEPELQQFAARQLGAVAPSPEMRCLTLLGTAGEEPAWNSRHLSKGHRVIPLASAEAVHGAPMIARLIEDLGLDIESIIHGSEVTVRSTEARTYDVFHVEQALGSPVIPAQDEFVIPYAIRSVVGFGGVLRSGELFAVILFSRAPIPVASAHRFRTIALDIRSAVFPIDEAHTWNE